MNDTTQPAGERQPLWSDDEFPWVNAEMNSNTRLGIAARIISRWTKDWHREGKDEATYNSAHNDIQDLADALTEQLAALTTLQQENARLAAELEERNIALGELYGDRNNLRLEVAALRAENEQTWSDKRIDDVIHSDFRALDSDWCDEVRSFVKSVRDDLAAELAALRAEAIESKRLLVGCCTSLIAADVELDKARAEPRYVPVEYNDIINVDNGLQIRIVIDQGGRHNGVHLHIRKRIDGEWKYVGLTTLADEFCLSRLVPGQTPTNSEEA